MLYPKNLEEKFGFQHVRAVLLEGCKTKTGKEFVDKIRFSHDRGEISRMLTQTNEFKRLLEEGVVIDLADGIEIFPFINKIKLSGSWLEASELLYLVQYLSKSLSLITFFESQEDEYPSLKRLGENISIPSHLFREVERSIDEKGAVRNTASKELNLIRKDLIDAEVKARKVLNRVMSEADKSGFIPEGMTLTVRGGRMVIPVHAEYKRVLKGFVHDESSTGQTVFMEPTEVLEINNDIRDLQLRERREVIRILTALTDQFNPFFEDLTSVIRYIGLLDFIRSKARLAVSLDCVYPSINKDGKLEIIDGYNPVLLITHKGSEKPVRPLTVSLERENRILIISGPNAGGKSVALKTMGLIQYMLQCGMLVPVGEGSTFPLFREIFADIGDEQSIENDLSTYSSHLKNMSHFIKFCGKRTLFLIDEFGTGTEPKFGGTIAEAILEELLKSLSYGVITTHYGNLKAKAESTDGLVNGSMLFDQQKLEPLYMLEQGKPGSSFAFEIASKTGIPESVIEKAKSFLGEETVNMEELLHQLEKERLSYSQLVIENKQLKQQLSSQIQSFRDKESNLDVNRNKYISEAKEEAKRLIKQANKDIENTIRRIKEANAEKEATKEARKKLSETESKLKLSEKENLVSQEEETINVEEGPIEIGDSVRIKGQEAIGEVLEMKGKDVTVAIGQLQSTIKLNRLEKISKRSARKQDRDQKYKGGIYSSLNLNKKLAEFNSELDIRGKRVEEAFSVIEAFMDDAHMLGMKEVRILHGKGNGVLKEFVRNQLGNLSFVKSFRDEHADRGGAGITIVKLS
ncbi:endonuclease MutS2 [Marinigracilibium pacificum]|uniref:Endonuclease MutS2 n=1 Tax=Marinigracilibium pacificum TaxID=2729599 RepID=A0A848J645_9BACT|nr:endonuclease MutS2 [Marinigracilibium pacificum]NMM48602.1 endonuclease MutS2 [Marinigracilibium pacificum]